jgi:hypothetical protein
MASCGFAGSARVVDIAEGGDIDDAASSIMRLGAFCRQALASGTRSIEITAMTQARAATTPSHILLPGRDLLPRRCNGDAGSTCTDRCHCRMAGSSDAPLAEDVALASPACKLPSW